MATHDRIVIGASAGGVQALKELVAGLPADLPAAVFIVLHLPSWHRSEMPAVLNSAGPLRAFHPRDGEVIENGRIYIAPPGRHLLVEHGHVHLGAGPKENRHRPSINVLFRSAAVAYGPRVVGVVLTGALDDGTSGLWEVQRRGGIAIVQEPSEAPFPDMPRNALENVKVDHVVPVHAMPALFTSLAIESSVDGIQEVGTEVQKNSSQITCPECRGPISEFRQGALLELRCRVGHAYSPEGFLSSHAETRERTLWQAILSLEEGAEAARRFAADLSEETRAQVEREANDNTRAAADIREVLASLIRRSSDRFIA